MDKINTEYFSSASQTTSFPLYLLPLIIPWIYLFTLPLYPHKNVASTPFSFTPSMAHRVNSQLYCALHNIRFHLRWNQSITTAQTRRKSTSSPSWVASELTLLATSNGLRACVITLCNDGIFFDLRCTWDLNRDVPHAYTSSLLAEQCTGAFSYNLIAMPLNSSSPIPKIDTT